MGEDSEAGFERAEVVLLEAVLAASTALDIVGWLLGGGGNWGVSECAGRTRMGGEAAVFEVLGG